MCVGICVFDLARLSAPWEYFFIFAEMAEKSISRRFGSIAFMGAFILTLIFSVYRDSTAGAFILNGAIIKHDVSHLPTSNPIPFEERGENTNENREDSSQDFHDQIVLACTRIAHDVKPEIISASCCRTFRNNLPTYLQTHSLRI